MNAFNLSGLNSVASYVKWFLNLNNVSLFSGVASCNNLTLVSWGVTSVNNLALVTHQLTLDSNLASLICRLLQLLTKLLFHCLHHTRVLILNQDYKLSFKFKCFQNFYELILMVNFSG